MLMKLRHLRYFVAVAEEGHITRAARRLGLQQPPLSMQIQQLEAELGTALFRRVARGVELTAAGRALLEDAQAILASVQRAAERTGRAALGQVGRLSVSFTTSAMLHPLAARLIRAFRDAYVEVGLDLHEGNASEVTRAVRDGAVTAAMLRAPVERPPGMVFTELLQEELLLALPADYKLPGTAGRAVALAELAGEPFILVRRPGAPGIYENVVAACRAAGFEPVIAAEVPHMLTNVNLVAAGMGVSVVPASMREVRVRDVQYRRLRGTPALTAPLSLAYLGGNADPILANLVAMATRLARVGG